VLHPDTLDMKKATFDGCNKKNSALCAASRRNRESAPRYLQCAASGNGLCGTYGQQRKKADFRNVILIMTSNAGAREVGRTLIGFDSRNVDRSAMTKEVERIFSPEFETDLMILWYSTISMKRWRCL